MLVLTRKVLQQIRIGDAVVITILRVKGNSVRVGIDAPKDQKILRTELLLSTHELVDDLDVEFSGHDKGDDSGETPIFGEDLHRRQSGNEPLDQIAQPISFRMSRDVKPVTQPLARYVSMQRVEGSAARENPKQAPSGKHEKRVWSPACSSEPAASARTLCVQQEKT